MRTIAIGVTVVAGLCSGQNPELRDRTFYLTQTPAGQQLMEVATVIRTIAEIQQLSTDQAQNSVTVHANPGQIAMAEWLFNELDTQAPQTSVPHEYRVPDAGDDVVRLFYITTAATVQDFQEISTLVRTITGIRRVFTYNGRKALMVRGTDAQVGLAGWLVKELEPEVTSSTHEYRMEDFPHDFNVVHVLRLTHTGSVQDFQKAAMQIRTAANLNYIFTYNTLKAVAVRGTADQIATVERVATQLDKP